MDRTLRDVDAERTVRFGLRLRRTGEMLRVEHTSETYGDAEFPYSETVYALSTDADYPLYEAGSAEEIVLLFASGHPGTSRHSPNLAGFGPDDLEAVAIEETVTRRVRPTGLGFEVPVKVDGCYAIDLHPGLARDIEGLGPVIEAVSASMRDLERQPYPGTDGVWGKCHLHGKIVAGEFDDLPDGWLNGIVMDKESRSTPRRAIAALPLPDAYLHLTERRGVTSSAVMMLVCLNDHRQVPESLAESLAAISHHVAPSP